MRWRELTPVADRISARIQTHLASRSAFAVRFRRSDTVARFGSDRLQVVTDANRRKKEEALREIEDRLKRMADSIPEVIWITDLEPAERVVYTSPSFERVWGFRLADLYQNPRLWMETIHPEDRARVGSIFSEWIAGADVSYQDVEFRIVQQATESGLR
jgi:PAS domain S-box-containing protein